MNKYIYPSGAILQNHFTLKRSVMAVALTLVSSAVLAQQTEATAPVQKVYVTGSNIKRADKEGSSPIAVMTAKQIAETGAANVAELLRSIPSMGTGTSIDITDGGFSRGASTASLRGLGSSSTLVLLNGRRITASAYADPNQGKSAVYDLNSIPISAVERVEVFKDGASAVYGSDAIAGVINFITKSDYQGLDLKATARANDDGEFGMKGFSGVGGFGDLAKDKFNAFISFDLGKRDSTLIKDVKDIQHEILADVNGRLNPLSTQLTQSPFFYRERTPGARNFANSFALRADVINRLNCPTSEQLTGSTTAHNLAATSTLVGRTFCTFNLNDYSEAQAAGKDGNVMSRLTWQMTPDITAFAELGYTRSERTYLGAPRAIQSLSPSTVFTLEGAPSDFQVILPVGHPDNPFPTSRSAIGIRFTDRPGSTENTNEQTRVLAGFKGTTGNWDWESAFLYNRADRDEVYYNLLNKPTLNRIMTENRTIAATLADPTSTVNTNNKGFASVTQIDAKGSTTVGKLQGGDIGLAFGAEARLEKIGLTPDLRTQRGDIVGLSNSSADGERKVYSAFVEMRTPFLKNFEMDFAGRYDKYPTMKAFVPKVGAKWTINDKATLRATFAEGFRAPALTQVSKGGVQSFTTITDSIRCPDGVTPVPGATTTDCARGISSLSAATPDLNPETSRSFNIGGIFDPMPNFSVVVDYYNIKKKQETALLSAQFVVDHQDDYPGRVIRDNNPANLIIGANGQPIPNSGPISMVNRAYVNQGSTQVSGVDIEMTYKYNLGEYGRLTTGLNWAHTLTYERVERPGETPHNLAGTSGGISDWATSVGDIPRHRTNLTANWTRGVHSLSGSVEHISAVSLLRRYDSDVVYPTPYCYYGTGQPSSAYQLGGLPKWNKWMGDRCEVPSWTTLNMSYAYTGFKDWSLGFSVRNLLDTKAPYSPTSTGNVSVGFNTQLHNGFGRLFRVTAGYKFR
jgi:iron complex outermembrane receptor protein